MESKSITRSVWRHRRHTHTHTHVHMYVHTRACRWCVHVVTHVGAVRFAWFPYCAPIKRERGLGELMSRANCLSNDPLESRDRDQRGATRISIILNYACFAEDAAAFIGPPRAGRTYSGSADDELHDLTFPSRPDDATSLSTSEIRRDCDSRKSRAYIVAWLIRVWNPSTREIDNASCSLSRSSLSFHGYTDWTAVALILWSVVSGALSFRFEA